MNYLGETAALATALFWSISAFLFTNAGKEIGALQLNVDRMAIAAILLSITILIFGIDYHMSGAQILFLSLSGLVGLVVGDSFLFAAFKEIGPRLSLLIMSSNPAMAAIMAYFVFGEKLAITGIIGMSVTFIGISMVIFEKRRNSPIKFHLSPKGVLYSFIGAVGQATGLIFAKYATSFGEMGVMPMTVVRLVSSIAVMLVPIIYLKRYANPIKVYSLKPKTLKWVFMASILGPYLGITLSLYAIVHTKIGIASTLLSTTPIIMLPLSYFIAKEKIALRSAIGAIVAVGGIALLFLV